MIKAIAIDDEPLALTIIAHFCSQSDAITLDKTFTGTYEALKYLKKYPVDLLFLDINMPGRNGIDFYKLAGPNVMVIFTTAYSEYAVEGFNVNAIDYLLKPFSQERFNTAVDRAKRELNTRKASPDEVGHLLIRADYKLHKIEFDDILMIEGLDDYIRIHIKNRPGLTARMSMKSIIEKLPQQQFLRVHRSYIVPVKRITSLQNKSITIGDFIIPIGDTYKNDVMKYL
ncbi:MAG: LytR/AlgR family response regulator transcription factor [Flavobacterium sp.]